MLVERSLKKPRELPQSRVFGCFRDGQQLVQRRLFLTIGESFTGDILEPLGVNRHHPLQPCLISGRLGLDRRGDGFPLNWGKVRPPHIEDQHNTKLVAWVHRFMLDRVIEYERLALSPVASFASDPEPAAVRYDQRQMAHEPRVVYPD